MLSSCSPDFPFLDEDLNSNELHPSAAHKCWSIRRGLAALPSPPQLPSHPGSPISLMCRGGSESCKKCGAHSGWWWRLGADQRLFLCCQQKHWKSSIPRFLGSGGWCPEWQCEGWCLYFELLGGVICNIKGWKLMWKLSHYFFIRALPALCHEEEEKDGKQTD